MITVFPKGPFAVLSLIVLLTSPGCNQLNRFRDGIFATTVSDQKMDVIACCHIVENAQPIALLRLKEPLEPTMAVFGKL
jgi:hypothetical protein